MPRTLKPALVAALTCLALVGCTTSTEQGVRPADETSAIDGVRVEQATWSAIFPGDVVDEQQPFPVDGVGGLTADLTYWETSTEALLVQVVTLPENDGDAATTLLNTASNLGVVITDSPLLDQDGTFRGQPAVVVQAQQEATSITLLAFYADTTLYQLMHITSSDSMPDRLAPLAASFELR